MIGAVKSAEDARAGTSHHGEVKCMTFSRGPAKLFFATWFVCALGLSATGFLRKMAMPFPQLLIFILTNLLLLCFWKVPSLHAWAMEEYVRTLVFIHAIRLLAGSAFLVYYSRGELPYAFAVPGGWGDIGVAVLGIVVCVVNPSASSRFAYRLWNTLGFVDILFVVSTAARLGLANPGSMRPLTEFPLALLPTFVVPIIIATHLLIFFRFFSSTGPRD